MSTFKYSLILVVLSVIVVIGCKSKQEVSTETNPIISDQKLKELLINKNTFIVDVRTLEEYEKGSIDGAVNIPHNTVKDHLNEFKEKKQILLYCGSGKRATSARSDLIEGGIKNVYNGGGYQRLKTMLDNK